MNDFKSELVEAIVSELGNRTDVQAIWEMGSAANGATDEYSDTDLLALVNGSIEEVFDAIESILENQVGITHRWVEPQSPRPGQWQRIYKLRDAPEHYYLDLGLLSSDAKEALHELMKPERHGTPVVYFDRVGAINPYSSDPGELRQKQLDRLVEITQTYPFVYSTVLKELDRGKSIDSYAFYFGLIRRLVDVLGIIHRPDRFDFGFRYLHKDLPKQLQDEVEKLIYVGAVSDLKERVASLDAIYQRNLPEAKKLVGLG